MFRADGMRVATMAKQAGQRSKTATRDIVPRSSRRRFEVDSPSALKQAGGSQATPVAAVSTPQASSPPEVQTVAKQVPHQSRLPSSGPPQREVVVDVVVTKGNDKSVLGLRQQDFNT